MENFQRFDLMFISEATLQNPSLWDHNPFYPSYVVVWSKLPDLETCIAALPLSKEYQEIPHQQLERIVDAFWFKAAIAIVKVGRNDLLIGFHLALDLERDCLALKMIQRDKKMKTTIHRLGGWGNELVKQFSWNSEETSGSETLNLIKSSCEIFDDLASELLQSYDRRAPLLFPSIESAKQICNERTNSA